MENNEQPPQQAGFKLPSIAGTEIWVRPGFMILAALFVFLYLDSQVPWKLAVMWVPILFISVLVHEFAHAAAIAAFGHGSSVIELGGFGGLTTNARPIVPLQEVVISLVGPISSFLLAGVLYWGYVVAGGQLPAEGVFFTVNMIRANIFWGIFNLIPIYPLDGGQALFNLLSRFTRTHTAYGISSIISIALAIIVGLGSLLARQFFIAIVAASLLMQNWRNWQSLRAALAESANRQAHNPIPPVEPGDRDNLG